MDWPATAFVVFVLSMWAELCEAIDCYVCSSENQSDQNCEDPFHTNLVNYLKRDCFAFRKGKEGSFPADHCIKIGGTEVKNLSHSVLIRTCALDSGSLTADTEIVRMSHCGHFYLGEKYFAGCVQSCARDGCNAASKPGDARYLNLIVAALMTVFCTSNLHISSPFHFHRLRLS